MSPLKPNSHRSVGPAALHAAAASPTRACLGRGCGFRPRCFVGKSNCIPRGPRPCSPPHLAAPPPASPPNAPKSRQAGPRPACCQTPSHNLPAAVRLSTWSTSCLGVQNSKPCPPTWADRPGRATRMRKTPDIALCRPRRHRDRIEHESVKPYSSARAWTPSSPKDREKIVVHRCQRRKFSVRRECAQNSAMTLNDWTESTTDVSAACGICGRSSAAKYPRSSLPPAAQCLARSPRKTTWRLFYGHRWLFAPDRAKRRA